MNALNNRFCKMWFFVLLATVFVFYIYRNVAIINVEFFLGLLLISSIFVIKKLKTPIPSMIWVWSGLIFFYWAATIIASLIHIPLGDRAITVLSTANLSLIFIFTLVALYKLKPSLDFFWYLMIFGAIVVISLGLADAYAFHWFEKGIGSQRLGGGHSHPVKYAVIANSFFVILLGSFPWALKKGIHQFVLVVLIVAALLVIAILTKSRTSWIGWPEAIIGWGIFYGYLIKANFPNLKFVKSISVSVFVVMIIGVMQIKELHKPIVDRSVQAINDVENYVSGKTMMTSIGKRLASYELALEKVPEVFWFGIGEDAFPSFLAKESKNFAKVHFNENIKGFHFSQLHNQFLMSFLTKGIFVFLSVVMFFMFLIYFFSKRIRQVSNDVRPVAVAGMVFTISSFLAFMPETPLQNTDMTTHFFLISSLLIVFSLSGNRHDEGRASHG